MLSVSANPKISEFAKFGKLSNAVSVSESIVYVIVGRSVGQRICGPFAWAQGTRETPVASVTTG